MSQKEHLKARIDSLCAALGTAVPYKSNTGISDLEEMVMELEAEVEEQGLSLEALNEEQHKTVETQTLTQAKAQKSEPTKGDKTLVKALSTFGFMDGGDYKELVADDEGYVPTSELECKGSALEKGVAVKVN